MAKRFWTETTTASDAAGHYVRLDGRELKTPGKHPVRVPSAAIAHALAAEWDAVPLAVDGDIDPSLMPVTRLAFVTGEWTASDKADERREGLVDEARAYAGTDLLSYRSPEPAAFVAHQTALWQPWLDWAAERGVKLDSTTAITPIAQPEASLDAVADYARALPDFALTLFVHLVAVYGSAVLAMAVMERELDPGEAFDLSRMDELQREEIWGVDEDDSARRAALRDETAVLGGLVAKLSDHS